MPVAKLTCPHCEAVLRPSKPLKLGRRVTCPKCGTGFVVPGEEMDVVAAEPEAPPKPAAPRKESYEEDDDSGPATYSFVDEPAPLRKRSDIDVDDEDKDKDNDKTLDKRE